MDIKSQLAGILPLRGYLRPLPTIREAHPVEETGEAYVAEIDIKSANKVVKLLQSKFPRDPELTTSHLRRFAKADFLPASLKEKFSQPATPLVIYVLVPPPVPDRAALQTLLQPYSPSPRASKPSSSSSSSADGDGDDDNDNDKSSNSGQTGAETTKTSSVRIESTRIPLQPPISEDQAASWSRTLWPTVYNPAARPASHSPPPFLLAKTKESVEPRAGLYLSIARHVAREARQSGRGRGVGVVVVDPTIAAENLEDPLGAIVAVAGDARYWDAEGKHSSNNEGRGRAAGEPPYDPDTEGHPAHHAVMRAASIVSHRRLIISSSNSASSPLDSASQPPSSSPQEAPRPLIPPPSPLEAHFLHTSRLLPPSGGGYLCTGLDLYSTHEPCLCCAMGMLLSRFRTVVIPARRKGSHSVGASLDAQRGYGLHWRPELNWRALGFEFVDESDEAGEEVGEEDVVFHA
ncbi:hypothetical protein VTO42DRAFT_365 [Malbranchea cinnamomea]